MATALGAAIDFLRDFGFFDVILPFLLVFTIIFGILEKTRIFGEEDIEGTKFPKKNINSMVAFVIAFFVVATKEVVISLQLSLPKVALVLVLMISFLMLAGSFLGDKEISFEERKGWKIFLTLVMFIAVVLIFADSFGWLTPLWNYILTEEGVSAVLVPLVLIGAVVGTIAYVVGRKPASGGKEE